MHEICKKICKKYARNMQEICKYMQGSWCPRNMQKYASYMQFICKNIQNMQSRFSYAKYAKICTPHFADVRVRRTRPGRSSRPGPAPLMILPVTGSSITENCADERGVHILLLPFKFSAAHWQSASLRLGAST